MLLRHGGSSFGRWGLGILFCAAALAACLAACDGRRSEKLRVTGTIPAAGEPFGGSLTVVFNKPIQAPFKDGLTTDSSKVFDPPLRGQVRFGTNFLTLDAAVNKLPGSIFETRLTSAISSPSGEKLDPQQPPLVMTADRFELARLWINNEGTTQTVLGLRWPVAVEPAQLQRHLTLADRLGKPVEFKAWGGSSPEIVLVGVAAGTPMPVKATVAAGMPEAKGRFSLAKAAEVWSPVQDPLRVWNGGWLTTGPKQQAARLVFSRQVSLEALKQHLRVEDISTTVTHALDYTLSTVSVSDQHTVGVYFTAPDPSDIKVRLSIDDGLRSENLIPLVGGWTDDFAVRTELEINWCDWDTYTEDLSLDIQFNYPLKLEDVQARLQVDPPVEGLKIIQQDSARFRLTGPWQLKQPYRLTLGAGIHFADWATLKESLVYATTSPKGLPDILEFPQSERSYYPRQFGNMVPLRTRGLKKLNIRLHQVFPNNIAMAVDDTGEHGSLGTLIDRWSRPVGEREIDLTSAPLRGMVTQIALDKLTSEPLRGIFCLQALSEDDTAYRLVLMTEIGLIAHWQGDQLVVFAHDLYTLEPRAGAKVTLYSFKNQVLGQTVTDSQGLARLDGFKEAEGEPHVVVVESKQDYTYLTLQNQEPEGLPDMSDLGAYVPEDYSACIYADRNLYRPGDTVHLRWIVRKGYGDALAGAPMVLTVYKPNGKSLLEKTIPLSDWGTATLDVPTQKDYATGEWRVGLKVPGGEQELGQYTFRLEEFVPNRMKSELAVEKTRWVAGEGPFAVNVTARHLFGAAASDRIAEAWVRLGGAYDYPQWPGFSFGNDSSIPQDTLELGEVKTGAEGKAAFACAEGSPLSQLTQPVRLKVMGETRELGGRAVSATDKSAVWFPSRVLTGVKLEPSTHTQELAVEVVAVRPDGSLSDQPSTTVTLERARWDYNVRSYQTHHEASFSDRFETVLTRGVPLTGGRGSVSFSVPEYGRYRITVRTEGQAQFCQRYFMSYGGRPEVTESPKPSLLRIELDKSACMVGQSARLSLDAPFDGQGLVVVQGGSIWQAIPVQIRNGHGVAEIPVKAEWYPNVWIEATVIHAIKDEREQVYPISSFAMTGLKVLDPKRQIVVDLPGLPEEVRPGKPFSVQIQTTSLDGKPVAAEVTLAAVDEGIHAITGYRNPDPLAWFGRSRRPDFRYANYYDRIFRRWEEPTAGGDGDVGHRLGRLGTNWIKTVALWSGAVRTGADGRASITLDLPEFNGELRLVAVAANQTATGMAGKPLLVRRPWIMQTNMPRFMLPDDRAQCVATVYNNSPSTCTAWLTVATSGTLSLDGATSGPEKAVLAPQGEAVWRLSVRAQSKPGQGMLLWKAQVADAQGKTSETLTEQALLPVGDPAAYERRHQFQVVQPGATLDIKAGEFLQDDWTELQVTAGANPLLRLQKSLADTIGYPYGCVEQTTSRLMSLYLVRRNSALLAEAAPAVGDVKLFLQAGIDRLFSMQTATGGLAFWPGSNYPYSYGSVYALHFLTLVRNDRELTIDKNDFELLQNYVRRLATDYSYDGSGSGLYQRAYAVYVLALGGDRDAINMIPRFDSLSIPQAGRYLLAAALAMSTRDRDRVQLYLNTAPQLRLRFARDGGNPQLTHARRGG